MFFLENFIEISVIQTRVTLNGFLSEISLKFFIKHLGLFLKLVDLKKVWPQFFLARQKNSSNARLGLNVYNIISMKFHKEKHLT